MNCKIPFTKDIDFGKKLYEITSISLEHEIKVEDNTLKGNFIISGDYKSHEVSVNKEPFSYILPFEIALAENIDEKTIEFMIEDFTYEVIKNNILRVNIDFNVIGSTKELEVEEPETIEDNLFREPNMEELTINNSLETKEEKVEEKVVEEENRINIPTIDLSQIPFIKKDLESTNNEEKDMKEETIKENTLDSSSKEEITKTSEDTIINSVNDINDEYATYHIHMVSDGESVETICTMYNSNLNILSEYNDLSNLSSGDKIIIPDKDE